LLLKNNLIYEWNLTVTVGWESIKRQKDIFCWLIDDHLCDIHDFKIQCVCGVTCFFIQKLSLNNLVFNQDSKNIEHGLPSQFFWNVWSLFHFEDYRPDRIEAPGFLDASNKEISTLDLHSVNKVNHFWPCLNKGGATTFCRRQKTKKNIHSLEEWVFSNKN